MAKTWSTADSPLVSAFVMLRGTLLANTAITNIVSTRIFHNWVDQDIPYPLIVIAHSSGGLENQTKTKAFDAFWRVEFQAVNDLATAFTMQGLLHSTLHDKWAISPYPDREAYATISEDTPYFGKDFVQNEILIRAGAYYRLRIAYS